MTDVRGYAGSVMFDGRTVTVRKTLRGETRIPVRSIQAVDIGRAGLGMRFIRFSIAGGSIAARQNALGDHRHAAADPNALTFRAKHLPAFEALRDEIEKTLGG